MDREEQIRLLKDRLSNVSKMPDLSILNDRSHMLPSVRYHLEISEIYTDFVLNILASKKRGVCIIDELILDLNKIDTELVNFIEKQDATKYGYAKIIKQTDKYIKLKITQAGIEHFTIISKKYKIKVPTQIERISLYTLKLIFKLTSFLFKSAPKHIKIAMESGITKFILFIIAVITFLLKWEEIKESFLMN